MVTTDWRGTRSRINTGSSWRTMERHGERASWPHFKSAIHLILVADTSDRDTSRPAACRPAPCLDTRVPVLYVSRVEEGAAPPRTQRSEGDSIMRTFGCVVGDTLYVTTSAGPRYVYAVNAKTGAIRWKYAPEIPPDVQQTTCCGLDNRGVAYAHGKLFVARLDAMLVALDAGTGKELWKAKVVDYKQGHAITSTPTIAK